MDTDGLWLVGAGLIFACIAWMTQRIALSPRTPERSRELRQMQAFIAGMGAAVLVILGVLIMLLLPALR